MRGRAYRFSLIQISERALTDQTSDPSPLVPYLAYFLMKSQAELVAAAKPYMHVPVPAIVASTTTNQLSTWNLVSALGTGFIVL